MIQPAPPPPNPLLLHPSEISKASGARHLISAPCSCSSNNRSFPSWSRSQVFVPTSLIHCLLSKVSQVQLVMKVFLCKLRSTHALVIVDAMANVPQFMQICRNKFKRLYFFPLYSYNYWCVYCRKETSSKFLRNMIMVFGLDKMVRGQAISSLDMCKN